MVGLQAVAASPPVSPRGMDGETGAQANGEASTPTQTGDRDSRGTSTSADKYFIVKSLTLQDLELSVRNGIWATQSHNEETLNKAFEVRFIHKCKAFTLLMSTGCGQCILDFFREQIRRILWLCAHDISYP